ncbi:hypothetical protein AT6N2_C3231 [Agrobacterium tumefaciens]|nr:hypothetical protein AT6N2_C3231 [Agrobacterium tumefaciens]
MRIRPASLLACHDLLQRRVGNLGGVGACRFLGDDRIGAAAEQRFHRALVIGLVQRTLRAGGELGDFAHHALLMLFRLRAGGVVFENDIGGLVGVFLGPFPALHRGTNEFDHVLLEFGVLEFVFENVESVFQRRHAFILIFEGDEVFGLDAGVENLAVFIIGHRRNAGGLFLQKRIDVETLFQHGHAIGAAGGRDFQVRHPRQERIFIAEEPDAQRLALEILRFLDAGFLQAGQHHARGFERLGDVDERHALFAGGKRRRHPVDDHVGPASSQYLRRCDIRATGLDIDVEAFGFIKALVLGDVITGELRLGDPFQLQGDLVGGLNAKCGQQ